MKKFAFAAVLVVALVVAGVTMAQTSLPGSGWWSGVQAQNVGTAVAALNLTAYTSAGVSYSITPTTLAVGEAATFIPSAFVGMPGGFQGAAVLSSDQPVKAIVNTTNLLAGAFGVANGKAAAQYAGMDVPATTLYFPLVKQQSFNKTTAFYVQNAGTADATLTAVFTMRDGTVYNHTVSGVKPNTMAVFTLGDVAGYTAPVTQSLRVGGLVVSSAQPLAGAYMEFTHAESPATVLNSTRGAASADFDTKSFAPVVKRNRFGRFTGIQVANVGTDPITVTVTYIGSAPAACKGTTYTDVKSGIPGGTSYTFVQFAGSTNFPDNCTGAANIQGSGNFVAIVNEQNVSGTAAAGITYSAMANTSATKKIAVPLYKETRFNNTTGLQIMNVGAATASNVVATFACKGGATFTAVSNAQTITAGSAFLFYKPSTMTGVFTTANPFPSGNVNCGVTVTSDQNVVAIVNEMSTVAIPHVDDNNYEGFNLTP